MRESTTAASADPPQTPFHSAELGALDDDLVRAATSGSQEALETLLSRHRPWIHNIALRMLCFPADAEDATQDILIKVCRGLASFRGESQFRTWLYRVAVNHLLNVKKTKWTASEAICSFADAARGLAQTPDLDPPDPRTVPVPFEVLAEETKISCTVGTLLCLDGRQRLTFILGEVFGVSDEVGAEIVEVTPANFRQILSRARRDLYEYLKGNCSLVDPERPCSCARKTRAFIQGGFVDPATLRFTSAHRRKVHEVAPGRADELFETYERVAADVYRNHPFYEPEEQVALVREALARARLASPK